MYGFASTSNANFKASGIPRSSLNDETIDFQTRMLAASGNTLTPQQLYAVNWLISQYKYYNLWMKLTAYYPLVGGNGSTGSLNSFKMNLKSSSFPLTNAGGITDAMCTELGFQNSGSSANGSTCVWNTGISDTNNVTQANRGMSCYIRTDEIKNNIYDMGCHVAYTNMKTMAICTESTIKTTEFIMGALSPAYITQPNPSPHGFYSLNRLDEHVTAFKNGHCFRQLMQAIPAAVNQSIYLNCSCRDVSQSSLTESVSTRSYGSWAVHQAYTIAEEKIRCVIEQGFQNLLSRAATL